MISQEKESCLDFFWKKTNELKTNKEAPHPQTKLEQKANKQQNKTNKQEPNQPTN